jgi:hypothetical protein
MGDAQQELRDLLAQAGVPNRRVGDVLSRLAEVF